MTVPSRRNLGAGDSRSMRARDPAVWFVVRSPVAFQLPLAQGVSISLEDRWMTSVPRCCTRPAISRRHDRTLPTRSISGRGHASCFPNASPSVQRASVELSSGRRRCADRSRHESGIGPCHRSFLLTPFFHCSYPATLTGSVARSHTTLDPQWATHDEVSDVGSATRSPAGGGCEVRSGIRKLVRRSGATASVDTERW